MNPYLPISQEQAIEKTLTINKIYGLSKPILFKGLSSDNELGDFYSHDPTQFIRPSAVLTTSGNAYNLLLNNLPNWVNTYPLRERSIVASTNTKTAEGFSKGAKFGNVYVVIPDNADKIVVAPKSDIWYSFSDAFRMFHDSIETMSLKQFNRELKEISRICNISNFDLDWGTFVNSVNYMSHQNPIQFSEASYQARTIQSVLYGQRKNLWEFLNNAFSPDGNKFSIGSYDKLLVSNEYNNNEVWTSVPTTLIEINKYLQIIEISK